MNKIDLRSDTVTWPTPAMRQAMANAPVGDDVYGDDPTMNELEALAAKMVGKEAALFVPSGTFGNQLALFTWCPRGSEVILGEQCHIIQHEAGAASLIAGVQTRTIDAPGGILPPEAIKARIRGIDIHYPETSLVCLENAHSSGKVIPLSYMAEVSALAKAAGLPLHLDGARLFNAAASLHVDAAEIASQVDSVMFCLSKGLCAPVGSMLAGTRDFIAAARRKRKPMGGGLRQAGILAAAGLIALKEMTKRLAEDHENARRLAQRLSLIPGFQVRKDNLDINMVFFSLPSWADGKDFAAYLAEGGILASPPEGGFCRFVTHYWISQVAVDEVGARVAAFAASRKPA
ncbi:MAG: low-specificity L-threonine aldolase [Spirochaetes bacterium]|nr:low-specificity L-threonine aldolase [Spirochaetota bacterium]